MKTRTETGKSIVFRWNINLKFPGSQPNGIRIPMSFYSDLVQAVINRLINPFGVGRSYNWSGETVCEFFRSIRIKENDTVCAVCIKKYVRPFISGRDDPDKVRNFIVSDIFYNSIWAGVSRKSSTVKHNPQRIGKTKSVNLPRAHALLLGRGKGVEAKGVAHTGIGGIGRGAFWGKSVFRPSE
jgi:hypothetical protein